ncbi:MAG TPA: glycosyltransferase family 4 protein [Chitinophagales bacterium]|nr:glycosyltransferase family 4 protein [Chitinophagales bacterium]
MKVLHVIKLAGLGGAEVYLSKILPELNKAGVQCALLGMINPAHREGAAKVTNLIRSLGVEVIELDAPKDFSWSLYKKIAQIIQEGKYDLVNTHLIHSELYTSMVKKFFIRDLILINTRHGYYPDYQVRHGFEPIFNIKDKFWWLYKFNSGSFNRTISISHGLKNLIVAMKLAKEKDIDVIHYGFDYDDVTYDSNTELYKRGNPQINIIGRLDPVKGHTFAFQALPKIIQKFPNVKLTIIGSGGIEADLKKEVAERGLENNVEFMGFQTKIHDFLKNSDVTLIPSFAEGFCAVVLESNFNHTPVVCFDVPALNEIVDNEQTGVVVPKFDTDILADKIIKILDNKEYSKKLTDNAYHKLKTYFTMDRMLKDTIHTYEQVLSYSK